MDCLQQVKNIELEFLSPTTLSRCLDEDKFRLKTDIPVLNFMIRGAYKECLNFCQTSYDIFDFKTLEGVKGFEFIVRNFLQTANSDNRLQREFTIIAYGVSCLQLFVLCNWVGPTNAEDLESLFQNFGIKEARDEILHLLEIDGEPVYNLIDAPVLLYIAKTIFEQSDIFQQCKTVHWWCLRYISIHQQLLPERTPTLYSLSKNVIEKLMDDDFLDKLEQRSHRIQLHLEAGMLQLHYYQYRNAEENFDAATAISGIKCNFDGALGVRTRFQQKAVAQLRVQIIRSGQKPFDSKTPPLTLEDIPKALPLNDDTLLESVKFSEQNGSENAVLTAEEHALVLTMCTNMQKTSPSNRLHDEQILCVIQFLLSDPKSWSVHTAALRVRCFLERDRSRMAERSMMQLESLVKHVSPKAKDVPSDAVSAGVKRLSLFYSVWPKPSWTLQKQLASRFEALGVLSSALEIYNRLHMWEEAIACLIRTGRGHEAEQLIQEQLSIKETPSLLCLLGDVLQDPGQYEKAWEMSKHRFARAMRSLGAHKVSKKLYKEAVECFEKSLEVNYLQIGTWFSMGCAALAAEDFGKAAKSFQKCVSLNWDNFEAWTNLSTAFVRCNKKNQAFRALKEGLKCNFNRWELWENYLFVSVDIGQFNEVVHAYNRLLDLKDKYIDTQVLRILVRAITENLKDADEAPASNYKPKALSLFGRLTSKVTSDWEVWHLYAKLLGNGIAGDLQENDRALNYLQKALRSCLQRQAWEKDLKSASQIVALSISLIDACLHCLEREVRNDEELLQLTTSTRLSVNTVKAKLKMQASSLLKDDARGEYEDLARRLEHSLLSLSNAST